SRAGKIYHYPFRFFLDQCVKGLSDGRRNVQIDIAFKQQDIRKALTRHRGGRRSVFFHSIPSSSLHHHPGVSLGSKSIATLGNSRAIAVFRNRPSPLLWLCRPDADESPASRYSGRSHRRI